MTFKQLDISPSILKAVAELGYEEPTPIQQQSIPIVLTGQDLLGCAQTGTGKTAAFSIPIIDQMIRTDSNQRGKRKIRALVVAPTRELALQIDESIRDYSKYAHLRCAVIFGGVKQHSQTKKLEKGVDILVATPGRLLDLIQQGYIDLKDIEHFVLDEADRMLDMGFINDIKKLIAKLPKKRQSLFFSATMSKDVVALSKRILGHHPKSVSIAPKQTTAEKVEQLVYYVSKADKRQLLVHILKSGDDGSTLVFSRTKHGADKIVRILRKANISAEAIHGNKSQNARQRALKNFKDGQSRVLVATDIASRGIDVDDLSQVINYDLPNIPETYVHRIGRTGRADASGVALSFCAVDEKPYLKDIQKLIRQDITVIEEHPWSDGADTPPPPKQPRQPRNKKKRHQNHHNGRRQKGKRS